MNAKASPELEAEVSAGLAAAFRKNQPEKRDYVIDINGCYPWPVVIEFYGTPAEAETWNYPGCPAEVDIIAIRTKDGADIREVLPADFVAAIESDLVGGGL